MSEASSTSTTSTTSSDPLQRKWDSVYALRERIVRFVAQLERRTKLYPPPFHRATIGGDAHLNSLQVQHSEAVSRVAGDYMLGVFHTTQQQQQEEDTSSSSRSSSSSNSTSFAPSFLCNYPGFLLTPQEYDELNDELHENMGALYGFDTPLSSFVSSHWDDSWNPCWKEVDQWVLLGDPVTTGSNLNTLAGLTGGSSYNCEFRVNTRAEMKLRTSDGRYAVSSDMVTVHGRSSGSSKQGAKAVSRLGPHEELFVAYDHVIKRKQHQQPLST